jgi:hypothetical protein
MSPRLKKGLTGHQQELFYMATYELDMFRRIVSSQKFRANFEVGNVLEGDDRTLLEFGLKWLAFSLNGENSSVVRKAQK